MKRRTTDVDTDDLGVEDPANVHVHTPTTALDAHFPPQPESDGRGWGPPTNEWAPSNEPHGVFGLAEPSHGDVATATPVSDTEGHVDGGTTPDARLNLLDAVRGGHAVPVPDRPIVHLVETHDASSDTCRARQLIVAAAAGGPTPTTLLDENEARDRALIQNVAGGVLFVMPGHGGGGATVGVGAVAGPGFPLAVGATMEIKSGAMVEAMAATAAVTVAIWEELTLPGSTPGMARP